MTVHVRDESGGMANLSMDDPYVVNFSDATLPAQTRARIEDRLTGVIKGQGSTYVYYHQKSESREVARLSEAWFAVVCLLELPQLGLTVSASLGAGEDPGG